VVLLAILLLCAVPKSGSDLKAGFGVVDITPEVGASMPGSFRPRLSKGVRDPLYAVACIVTDGTTPVALVGIDALFIGKRTVQQARDRIEKSTKIPGANVLVAASHTHTGGPIVDCLGNPGGDPAYEERVANGIAQAVEDAWAGLQPCEIGIGLGKEDTISFNRRFLMKDGREITHPGKPGTKHHDQIVRVAGPIDPDVGVMAVRALHAPGRVLGVVVNFACHCTGMGGAQFSADYVCFLRKKLKEAYGEKAEVVFLNGACGDITQVDNLSPGREGGPEHLAVMGSKLSAEVVRTVNRMTWLRTVSNASAIETVPVRIRGEPDPVAEKPAYGLGSTEDEIYASERRLVAEERVKTPEIPCEVQGLRIGPLGIATNGAEYFTEYGLRIKQASPHRYTWFVELANEYLGYVPTAQAFAGGGYEQRTARSSKLAPEAGQRLVEGALRALNLLAPPSSKGAAAPGQAAETFDANPSYATGTPLLTDLWVDPAGGNDAASGATREQALRSLQAAVARVPADLGQAPTGYRLRLAAGSYHSGPHPGLWMDGRRGTFDHPLIIESADGPGKAVLPPLTIAKCSFVYVLGVRISASEKFPKDIPLHAIGSDHLLVRGVVSVAVGTTRETLPLVNFKCDQSRRLFVEDSEFDGAEIVTLDFVACQDGHIVRSKFHRSLLQAIYVKGGSAGFVIAGNEIWDSRVFGFCAGEGTGFQYMVKPWIHYEAYDIKFVNNVIHDTGGPAIAVQGGYNCLVAYNTCTRVGRWGSPITVGFGGRGGGSGNWDRICDDYQKAGGWCNPKRYDVTIPSKNVYLFNNLVLNDTFASERAHFGVSGPVKTAEGSNLPAEVRADEGLLIRGNVIANGPAALPAGDDEKLLHKENAINTAPLRLVHPERGDFRVVPEALARIQGAPIPDFKGGDLPPRPQAPPGRLCNQPSCDRAGAPRTTLRPGAWQ
jgi:neutral ceramidase